MGIVVLPRELTDEEVFNIALDMCKKDENNCVAYEELEEKMKWVRNMNRFLREE